MDKKYCSRCDRLEEPTAKFCTECGGNLMPYMRVVVMPFVESDPEAEVLPEYRQIVEVGLPAEERIGCLMYLASDMDNVKMMATKREDFFREAYRILPQLVKRELSNMKFYDIPDPQRVMAISEEAHNMPTELFVLIQKNFDPDFLFLPEVSHFFFRYPHPFKREGDTPFGLGFVQVSSYLLDNRENRIVAKGVGAGAAKFSLRGDQIIDENLIIDGESQMRTMLTAGDMAIKNLLKKMRMI